MADNVPITAGAGTNIAADDVGGVYYQRIKRSYGPDGSASDGLSIKRVATLSNTATEVKDAAGQVHGWHIHNPNSSIAYVHIYNIVDTSVTVGTSTPAITLALPSNSTATIGVDGVFPIPITFDTAISLAATTTIAGSTAPSTGILVNLFYL